MSTMIRKRTAVWTLLVAGSALTGAALHAGFVATQRVFAADVSAAPAATTHIPTSSVDDLSESFADLAERVTPSVVQIRVLVPAEAAVAPDSPQIPEEFRRFFDLPFGSPGPMQQGPRMGGGSGFVVTSDGYIVTNNHVVGDADRIKVTLNDRRVYEAKLMGSDPTTDVAVIKIDAQGLRVLPWGGSDDLRVGEWVMAVGNPGFGNGQLDYTVTSGIVSAKGRPLQLIARDLQADPRYGQELAGYAIENFIQTDAVINPGNSGGPLVNLQGEVVGMNSAIASTDGRYQGYGFAIPSNLVRKVATDLMEHGHVMRPWLGVQVTQVSPEDAEAYHLPAVSGVLVQAVTEGSPAASAGLEQGDVIVAVDDVQVGSGGALQEIIAEKSRGDHVRVSYYRDGRERTAEARLGEAPVSGGVANARSTKVQRPTSSERLGLTVEPLDQGLAEQLGYREARGVVIAQVDPAGPSAGRGVSVGVRLVRIGDAEVRTPQDVNRSLSDVSKGTVVTLVLETPTGDSRIANVRAR